MIESKTNSVSSLLKIKTDEILVTKTEKGNKLTDIDIIAINEWIENKDGVEFFNILRAFALLCNIVDGLEQLFFTIAKELPNKLELADLSTESIMQNFEGVDKSILSPFDYIKTLQKIFSDSNKTKDFVKNFNNTFLEDSLKEINSKFKLISIEEYEKLKKGFSGISDCESANNIYDFIDFANKIPLTRNVLKLNYLKETAE